MSARVSVSGVVPGTDAFGKAHVPYGEDGAGSYSLATAGAFSVIKNAAPLAVEAINQVLSTVATAGATYIRLADFGTADAGTSMNLLIQLIDEISKHNRSLEVEVSYEDQPNNDFKSLFFHTQGIRQVPGGTPPLGDKPRVFITASGTSFFRQCFPSGSVHLALSFTAMHWLSRQPGPISHGVHVTQLNGPRHAQERLAWTDQAAADWEAILLNRAKELVPGGRMVSAELCVSPEHHWLGHTDTGPCMYETMERVWANMWTEELITEEEYQSAAFINYYRNEEELLAPFQAGHAVHTAGLRLVSHEFKVVRCPFRTAWIKGTSKAGKDAKRHAKWYVPTLRSWSNSTFLSALSPERPAAERTALVDTFFERYEDEVASAPFLHGMDFVNCYMHIMKVAA